MHIPDHMLQGAICPATAALALAGVAAALVAAARSRNKPGVGRFAAVTALIFAAQMMNFPVAGGTSGHLLGAALAAALLGTPFAVLAMALVVAVQALVFGDGGLMVLGANILNMALIGVAAVALLQRLWNGEALRPSWRACLAYGTAGWLSVMLAALAVSLQLALAGTVPFATVAGAMLGVHALIGLGEGLITAAALALLAQPAQRDLSGFSQMARPFAAACGIGLLLSPLASSLPDGLERVAENLNFMPAEQIAFWSPLTDYQLAAVGHEALATGLAGLCGVLLTFTLAWLVARPLQARLG